MKGPESTTPSGDTTDLPLWRKQFPIDTAEDTSRTRREFVGGLAIAGGAMVCGQIALEKLSPVAKSDETFQSHRPLVLARKSSELQNGEAVLFHYPDHKSPCLLIRVEDDILAFSQKCTHLACPVIPNSEAKQFECPCHKGTFDLTTGAPLSGPPQQPLRKVQIEISDSGTITATAIQLS